MKYQLKTLGHATLLLLEDDKPLIATDPWLLGSTYWRSWWLEKYPPQGKDGIRGKFIASCLLKKKFGKR